MAGPARAGPSNHQRSELRTGVVYWIPALAPGGKRPGSLGRDDKPWAPPGFPPAATCASVAPGSGDTRPCSLMPLRRRSRMPCARSPAPPVPPKVLSGGTDLLVQLRTGRVRPDLIVDTKNIPGISGIERAGRRLRDRRRHPRRRDRRMRGAAPGLARGGRGRQPDRLHPDPGSGIARPAISATRRRPPTACRR